MTDADKRKEPTPDTQAAAPAKAEPEAKRLKAAAGAPDPAVIRKQVEYYLSDENLRTDKFFSEKIAGDAEGWLEMSLILSCNKMKAMRANKENVVAALAGSKLELKDGGVFVRRPANTSLPKLEAKPQQFKKNNHHAHDGGVVAMFRNIPAEQSWVQIKEKLQAMLPPKVNLWFVSEVSDKSQCNVACPPFEGDVAFFEGAEVEVGSTKLKCEICYGDVLQQTLKVLPKHIRDKRERESRKRQKERNRPIVLGSQKFVNVGALRGKVKEIMNSRSDGETLKPEGTDFKLIKALLDFHPKGPEKSAGTIGIKVAKSAQGDSRCFFLIKECGAEEDVSMKKCIDAVELNPPYVKVEKKGKEDEEGAVAKAAEPKEGGAKPAAEEAKPAAEAAKPAAEEAKPAAEAAKPAAEEAKPAAEAAKPAAEEAKPATVEAKPAAEEAKPAAEEAKPAAEEAKPAAEEAKPAAEEAKPAAEEAKKEEDVAAEGEKKEEPAAAA